MPLYETVMQEKPAVIFEIGSAYTKLGFAAESFPRFIIPTEINNIDKNISQNLFEYKTLTELYDNVVNFFQKLFFKYILVSPKDRKIVIVESVLCPTDIRETFAKVLFKHFEVSSTYFVPTHLVVLTTLAVDTAMVVDIGYKEAVVIPVYSGVQVLHAWQAQPLASESVHNEIRKQLIDNGVSPDLLTESVVEDIKVRTCFVTTFERSQMLESNDFKACPDVDYPIEGKTIIKIPGKLRETVFECIFPHDNDKLGLSYIILDAILKCPIDMRKKLSENILLIGGTTMIIGLIARLKAELLYLLNNDKYYKSNLFINNFKFHNAPSKANYTAWLGGSIYGGSDLVLTRSLAKESYSKHQRVPDWSNLEDYR